jgi:tetratricopeptide (TPR) repeat protein
MLQGVKTEEQTSLLDTITALLAQQKNQTCANQLMEKLVEKHPDEPAMLLAFARFLTSTSVYDRALESLKKIPNRSPEYDAAVPLYAHILSKQNKSNEAIDYLKKALAKSPDKKEWRVQYARSLAGAGRFEDSLKQFQLLLNENPRNPEFIQAIGLIALQLKQATLAKEQFNNLLKFNEHKDAAQYYLGQVAESEKKFDQAMQWYKQLEIGSNNYLSAQSRIANLLNEQGHTGKALAHLRNVPVESSEDRALLTQAEAELLVDQKRYDEALAIYNRSLDATPNSANLLYMRALLAEKMNKLDMMEKDLRKVLELEPNNVHALNALGYTLADRTTRYTEALELIQKALTQNPDDYYILDSMGWVLYRLGKYPQAIEHLRKAQARKEDPETAAHLGEVLWVNGEKSAAKTVWNKALKESPKNELLIKTMKKFLP